MDDIKELLADLIAEGIDDAMDIGTSVPQWADAAAQNIINKRPDILAAIGIIATVKKAMRRAGIDPNEVAEYLKASSSGDCDHLIQVTLETVTVN